MTSVCDGDTESRSPRLRANAVFGQDGIRKTNGEQRGTPTWGIDLAATPSFDEIVAEYSSRVARVGDVVAAVTDDQLG